MGKGIRDKRKANKYFKDFMAKQRFGLNSDKFLDSTETLSEVFKIFINSKPRTDKTKNAYRLAFSPMIKQTKFINFPHLKTAINLKKIIIPLIYENAIIFFVFTLLGHIK